MITQKEVSYWDAMTVLIQNEKNFYLQRQYQKKLIHGFK